MSIQLILPFLLRLLLVLCSTVTNSHDRMFWMLKKKNFILPPDFDTSHAYAISITLTGKLGVCCVHFLAASTACWDPEPSSHILKMTSFQTFRHQHKMTDVHTDRQTDTLGKEDLYQWCVVAKHDLLLAGWLSLRGMSAPSKHKRTNTHALTPPPSFRWDDAAVYTYVLHTSPKCCWAVDEWVILEEPGGCQTRTKLRSSSSNTTRAESHLPNLICYLSSLKWELDFSFSSRASTLLLLLPHPPLP